MTDTVAAALIGVAGAVLVAVTTVIVQLIVTRTVIGAERKRVQLQLAGEHALQRQLRREERLTDTVAELLAASDPQAEAGANYSKAVVLISRIQLLLNRGIESERDLNGAINKLGVQLEKYHHVRMLDISEKHRETHQLLEAHGAVLDSAARVVREFGVAVPEGRQRT